MRPSISEFSFGYALTEELATGHGQRLSAAPVFPSLNEEGKAGVGWDVKLVAPDAVPVMLQFKVGHPITRESARECKQHQWKPTFYRFHVRASRTSTQHASLVSLEKAGNFVRYVAPAFHRPDQLNDAYLTKQVAVQSFWLQPSAIVIADEKEHEVGYQGPNGPYCISSPVAALIHTNGSFEGFVRAVRREIEAHRSVSIEQKLVDFGNRLTTAIENEVDSLAARRSIASPKPTVGRADVVAETLTASRPRQREEDTLTQRDSFTRLALTLPPPRRAAYLVRTFFDAQLLLVGSAL